MEGMLRHDTLSLSNLIFSLLPDLHLQQTQGRKKKKHRASHEQKAQGQLLILKMVLICLCLISLMLMLAAPRLLTKLVTSS